MWSGSDCICQWIFNHVFEERGKNNVVVAKTGVKFVHAAAHHHFDVGVYFEANGHGTVLFGPKFYDFIANADAKLRGTPRNNRANIALRRLRLLPALVNQSVGDAMSDMLLVDAILFLRGWDLNTGHNCILIWYQIFTGSF